MLHHARYLSSPGRRRGFTIVEIVMACIIIGVLTLALVPVLTSQANNARLTSCRSDLENLANAQERAAIDTGYMFRPYALNDVSMGDGVANAPDIWPYPTGTAANMIEKINGIRDNAVVTGNLYTQNPSYIFISPTLQDFMSSGQQQSLFIRLTGSANGDIGTPQLPLYPDQEKKFGWNGPYIHWKRDVNNNDWPDDPWGNDYLFFTKNGILFPPERDPNAQSGGTGGGGTGGTPSQNYQDRSNAFQPRGPFYDNIGNQAQIQFDAIDQTTNLPIFDRPTWVSLGPDGIPGSLSKSGPLKGQLDPADLENYGYGKGDDLFYSFGGN